LVWQGGGEELAVEDHFEEVVLEVEAVLFLVVLEGSGDSSQR
jgi:hypothetical protein